MKPYTLIFAFSLLFASGAMGQSTDEDSTGMAGDNFSLEGALDLFKKASSPEDFERLLNSESNEVNNLDLDGDGNVDYIRVEDHMSGTNHVIVMQVAVSETELQDIAVIEIEKNGDSSATLQILGDEELYGKNKIAEPFDESVSGGKKGPSTDFVAVRVVVNVWGWPSVRFVYGPRYNVWVSPYRWRAYPAWYRPWRPRPWRRHHAACSPYRMHNHVVVTHRVVRAHSVYGPHRKTSVVVRTRHGGAHIHKARPGHHGGGGHRGGGGRRR